MRERPNIEYVEQEAMILIVRRANDEILRVINGLARPGSRRGLRVRGTTHKHNVLGGDRGGNHDHIHKIDDT